MEKINEFILCKLNCIQEQSTVFFCFVEVIIWHIFGNNRHFLF